jgi:hypothetical protein
MPICETSPATPPGQFSFEDLIMLLYQLPMEFHQNATWIMNQQTFALLLSQSDAMGRPLLSQMRQGTPVFTLAAGCGLSVSYNGTPPDFGLQLVRDPQLLFDPRCHDARRVCQTRAGAARAATYGKRPGRAVRRAARPSSTDAPAGFLVSYYRHCHHHAERSGSGP